MLDMSLSSSIQMASAALQANDIALQVVGQNIANANTPGYLRETVNFTPGPSQTNGALIQGTGVQVLSDHPAGRQVSGEPTPQRELQSGQRRHPQEYLHPTGKHRRRAQQRLESEQRDEPVLQLHLGRAEPAGEQSVRQSAVLQGQSLAQSINGMANQTMQLRSSFDGQISGMAPEINSLTSQIAQLNTQIATITGGGQSPSDANGLTDRAIKRSPASRN